MGRNPPVLDHELDIGVQRRMASTPIRKSRAPLPNL
jgi:hypothetical protein